MNLNLHPVHRNARAGAKPNATRNFAMSGMDATATDTENSGGTPERSGEEVPTESPTISSGDVPLDLQGYVYFVRSDRLGLIKIGHARDVRRRMLKLQTGSPDKLSLIGVIGSSRPKALEAELHFRFSGHRRHGEWFTAARPVMAFIREHVRPIGYDQPELARRAIARLSA